MQYYKHPDFINSVYNTYKKNGSHRLAATKVLAIITKAQEKGFFSDDDVISSFKEVKEDCDSSREFIKYNVGGKNILVVSNFKEEKIFLFVGSKPEVDVWLKNYKEGTFRKENIRSENLNELGVLVEYNDASRFNDIQSIVASTISELIRKYRNNEKLIVSHKEEVLKLRENIALEKAILEGSEISDIVKCAPSRDLSEAERNLIDYDCDSVSVHIGNIISSCKKGEINEAINTVGSVEKHVSLLRLRVEHISYLKKLILEQKCKAEISGTFKKLAVTLGIKDSERKKSFPEMIPNRIPAEATQGEVLVFKILRNLPHDCIVFYEPNILGRSPDFVIVSPRIGALVIEVKDWVVDYMISGNNDRIKSNFKGKESQKNPIKQAREYVFPLLNKCESLPDPNYLVRKEGEYQGSLVFPIGHMVVLSKIDKSQLKEHPHGDFTTILHENKVICKEELNSLSALSPNELEARLGNFFSPCWKFPHLTDVQIKQLRNAIHPEVNSICV